MNIQVTLEAIKAIGDCALIMFENASFIKRELPNAEMHESIRSHTVEVCESMVGTKHDVISELFEIDEFLESKTGWAEVLPRIERVTKWFPKQSYQRLLCDRG